MGTTIRDQKLPLVEYLQKYPKQFSFEMVAHILEHGAQVSFGKEMTLYHAPFRTKSINSFHLRGTEIETISEVKGLKTIYIERLSLSGLNAPLPTPYAELIFRSDQEKNTAMSEFVNTFNTRLLGISYQISRRRYLNLQNHSNGNCMLTGVIAAFSGESFNSMPRQMSRLSYLFWTKEKSAAGLEAIIIASLGFTVHVNEFRVFWANRREIFHLGNMKLGKTSELGERVSLSSFGIEIELTHNDYRRIFQLLGNDGHLKTAGQSEVCLDVSENSSTESTKKTLSEAMCRQSLDVLRFLVRKYLGEFFNCQLKLIPQNVPPLKIGNTALGKTSWIPGKKLDAATMVL